MGILKNDWVLLLVRLIVGGFFIYAAIDKIGNPEEFAKIVYNYRVLPGSVVNVFAIFLPWLELFSGIALVIGTRTLGAAAIITGLMTVFIIAVSSAIARGIKIDCGCFTTSGDGARQVGMPLIIQDAILLILALWIWIQGAGRFALDAASRAGKLSTRDEIPSASQA